MAQDVYEKIVSKLEDNLGIQIDKNSYDYDFIKTIADFLGSSDDLANQFINSYTFENLESNNLDNFLNFFDIYRKVGNNEDLYSIKLKYISSNQNSLSILKNCTVGFENGYYKVLKDTIINDEETILTVQKIFNINEIQEPVYSNKGTLIFDKKYLNTSESVIIESDLPKNLYTISVARESGEKESDFEFLEKSKNILQSYGYSNLKKIELALLEDTRIKSIHTVDSNNSTNIIIFPNSLAELDDIIEYNKNVVDIYKSSNIVLLKPNIFEVNISGLASQLNLLGDLKSMLETITTDLKVTLSLLYSETDTLTLKREEIISSLKKSINNLYLSGDIDFNNVRVNYNYYYRNNYNSPILNDVISDYETVKKSDILALGSIE